MIYDKASLVQIPSGYKSGTLYSVVPNTADGDFTVTGDPEGEAIRVNKDGLIETVAADVPRLNYNFIDGVVQPDPHLLLEPQRTNQFTNSENLANIDFQTNSTITPDNIIAPNGSLTADKTTQTSGGYLRETVSVSNGTTYSFSVFLKKGDLRYAVIRSLFSINGVTPANSNCIFDLDNGSVVYTGTDVVSASIEKYPNDWFRCSFVSVASATGSAPFIDFYFSSSSSGTQSSGVSGFGYGWGMQLEAGSYPSSYIPTTASAVTRTADDCTLTGFSDNLGQTEGVLFIDMDNFGQAGTSYGSFLKIYEDGDSTDRVIIQNSAEADNRIILVVRANSSTLFQPREDIPTGRNKIALKYKSGDIDVFLNGTKIETSSSTFTFANTLNKVQIGQPNKVYQAMIFNEALSDSELENITSYDSFGQMAKALLYTIE